MKHPIPDAVLAQHIAVLGKTGAGKTSTEKVIVEQVVDQDFRVCVLDTIKSDWWGITSSADGKRGGLPFRILGGPRGHVPLHSSAGKVIGQLVGSGKLPLSIIDMADFEAGGIQRFFVDFAPALMRSAKGVLYLVIEEAHEVAPKERAGFGAENMAIHWAKKLATAGRSKGIRLIVATQRVQSLHNAVLGSCETLIAHRLTTPADQRPVLDWLKANTDKDTQEKVAASLSSLPTGTGWICSGEARLFEQRAFPKFKTYDNTATPTGDSADVDVKTAPVDQDELRAIIGDAVKQAEADDPKTLRAEIARLTTQRDMAQKAGTKVDDAIASADRRMSFDAGFEQGKAFGRAEGFRACSVLFDPVWHAHQALDVQIDAAITNQTKRLDVFDAAAANIDKANSQTGSPATAASAAKPPARAVLRQPRVTSSPGQVGGDDTLTPALQKALDAVAWWRKIGVEPVERGRAAVVAGYSPRASTFHGYVATLVGRGLVETLPGKIKLTDAGLAAAHTPTAATADELRQLARDLLGRQEQRVFDAIYESYPGEIRREVVAEQVGLSARASTVHGYIANVAAYGIIETTNPGAVRAADWLFP